MPDWDTLSSWARPVARIGIALVFVWFGISQLVDPTDFMGYLPEFLLALEYASTIVVVNGVAELLLGVLLLVGKWTRPVAFVLALHLLGITVSLGYNDIAVRDFGLFLVTCSIVLGGADTLTLDYRRR